jgi:serine/threonine protein kinase
MLMASRYYFGRKVSHGILLFYIYDLMSQILDEKHVVQLLRHHDIETVGVRGVGFKRQLCLVMPLAERSLEHAISAERIAGRDLKKIRAFANDVGDALAYLHKAERQLVHADFKPRNIVRIQGDWKLIDLDATVQVPSCHFPYAFLIL